MYYELYIDVFFLENFMMDSLLLLIINRVMNNGRPPGRILLGGITGSLLTCLVVAVAIPPAVRTIIFHTLVNSAMLFAGLRIRRFSQFVQAFLLLYAAAVITGGIMQIFRPYMRYISLFYAAAFFSYAGFLKLWRLIVHMYRRQSRILKVTLYTEKGERSAGKCHSSGDCGVYIGSYRTGKRIPYDSISLHQRRICDESISSGKNVCSHGRGEMDRKSSARDRRGETVRRRRV